VAGFRILLAGGGTGGHLYPALNLARALRRLDPAVRLSFIGATRGIEARILPEAGYEYRLLPMQPLHRSRPWRNWRLLTSTPAVLRGLSGAFADWQPQLVVGTGGYVSGPALLRGIRRGTCTALQEQNAQPGLVTRLLASRVDQVHLGYPEAEQRLSVGSRTRVFAYGNPVAAGPVGERYPWPEGKILLVTGGSQGALGLNERLLRDLSAAAEWPAGLTLVWATGPAHQGRVSDAVAGLPFADRIRVEPFIPDLGAQLDRVALAISRAGAMFLAELQAAGVPAVLVPFPGAGAHQVANAGAVEAAGAAVARVESELRPGELWDTACAILADETRRQRMAAAARARGAPEAADRIAFELLELVGAGTGGERLSPLRRGKPSGRTT
jgi:UDP-N-acetylglucosamine--N-acetylmuramyl-(pentapeptide) pyrophosphoryl-undecaprenol N-acetylglucosamine transferase